MNKFRKTTLMVLIVLVSLFLISCGGLPPARGNKTVIKDDQTLPVPSPDTAVIVFLNSGTISDVIYDVTSESPKLVGLVKAGTKITYEVSAGEHYFLTASGHGFMAANVTGGRTYYVLVQVTTLSASLGLATTVFISTAAGSGIGFGQPIPVRIGGEGIYHYSEKYIQKKLENDELVEITQKAQEYYTNELWISSVKERRKSDFPKFKNMPEADPLKVTLNPEDGMFTGYYSNQNTQMSQGDETESNPVYSSQGDDLKALGAE